MKDEPQRGLVDMIDWQMMRPYLGRWAPTSFREEMNVASVTIAATGLSFEKGARSLSWR
jgi:hypothetical protein